MSSKSPFIPAFVFITLVRCPCLRRTNIINVKLTVFAETLFSNSWSVLYTHEDIFIPIKSGLHANEVSIKTIIHLVSQRKTPTKWRQKAAFCALCISRRYTQND